MRSQSAALLAFLALSACGPDGGAIDEVKGIFAHNLNDPQSAQYRNLKYIPKTDKLPARVCGEVNYRNTMGGYVGFENFIARQNPDWLVTMGGPNDKLEDQLAAIDDCELIPAN